MFRPVYGSSSEYNGRMLFDTELLGRKGVNKQKRPQRRFIDVLKKNIGIAGVAVEESKG